MPLIDLNCSACDYTWEDIFFTGDEIPNECPKCKSLDCIKKLISLPGPGKVRLGGAELKSKIMQDAKKLKQDAARNPNLMENLVGPDKFQKNELIRDKVKVEATKKD